MKKNLVAKVSKRGIQPKNWRTSTIIDEIFELSDKTYKDTLKINVCMKELKQRGSDDIYLYYKQYIRNDLQLGGDDTWYTNKRKQISYLQIYMF